MNVDHVACTVASVAQVASKYIERYFQRPLQFGKLGFCKRPNELGEVRFAQADKVVAHNPTRMFQSFLGSDRHLGGQAFAAAKYRSTNYRRKFGLDEHLPAYDHKRTVQFGVASGLVDPVKLSSLQTRSSPKIIPRAPDFPSVGVPRAEFRLPGIRLRP